MKNTTNVMVQRSKTLESSSSESEEEFVENASEEEEVSEEEEMTDEESEESFSSNEEDFDEEELDEKTEELIRGRIEERLKETGNAETVFSEVEKNLFDVDKYQLVFSDDVVEDLFALGAIPVVHPEDEDIGTPCIMYDGYMDSVFKTCRLTPQIKENIEILKSKLMQLTALREEIEKELEAFGENVVENL